MTIIQIPCDYGNKAPPGCLQFYFGFTGDNAQGVIQSFNFNGNILLILPYALIYRELNTYCMLCIFLEILEYSFKPYDMNTLWFKFGHDIFSGFKIQSWDARFSAILWNEIENL